VKAHEFERGAVRPRKIFRSILLAGIFIMIVLILLKIAPLNPRPLPGMAPVRTIQVSGTGMVEKREIVQMLGPGVSGSLLLFSVKKAESSLLSDARITQVEMAKLYPDTLRVWVREKDTAAVIITASALYPVSADGTVLARLDPGAASRDTAGQDKGAAAAGGESAAMQAAGIDPAYPRIRVGADSDDINSGQVVRDTALLELLGALEEFTGRYAGFMKTIDSFQVDRDGVTVTLHDDRLRVYLGPLVSFEKLERLRAMTFVLTDLYGGETALDVDMSFSHAAVRERESNELGR
jgi:hypothetical protein